MGPVDPGATPTVSANGDRNGIVWTVTTRTWEIFPEKLAVLHAYDAADVSRELYSSEQNSDRERAGISVRFTIPTVISVSTPRCLAAPGDAHEAYLGTLRCTRPLQLNSVAGRGHVW